MLSTFFRGARPQTFSTWFRPIRALQETCPQAGPCLVPFPMRWTSIFLALAERRRCKHNRTVQFYDVIPGACERAGTDWIAPAFDVTVSYFAEMRDHSPLVLASARAVGHAATLAKNRQTSTSLSREADLQELLRMKNDAPRESHFQIPPFRGGEHLFPRSWRDCHLSTARSEIRLAHLRESGCVQAAGHSVPQRRTADHEHEDIYYGRGISSIPSFRLPSLPGSASECRDEVRRTV
jgi:hypothetical protein